MTPAFFGRAARSRSSWLAVLFSTALVCLFCTAGCRDSRTDVNDPALQPVTTEAGKLLMRMIEKYSKADTYQDRGELRISGRKDGQSVENTLPFAVFLQRPAKLYMHLYRATYVSDGTWAWSWDESLPGIIAKRPAPKAASLVDVYSDEVIKQAFQAVVGDSLPAQMLLGADALDLIAQNTEKEQPELMSDEFIGDRNCRRVRVKRHDGNMIYWIDRADLTLRRIDIPSARIERTLADVSDWTEIKVTAEFVDAQLNQPVEAAAFEFQPPPQLKIAERLDPLWGTPEPAPLSQALGQKIGDFRLRMVTGPIIGPADLKDKVAVLYFVSLDQLSSATAINDAYKRLAGNEGIKFCVVNINAGMGDDALRSAIKKVQLEVPVAQVVDESSTLAFDVRFIPSLVIIDRTGTIQDIEVGITRDMHVGLGARIEDVLAGRSIVEQTKARHAKRVHEHAAAQQVFAGLSTFSTPLAPKSQPKSLKLTEAWKNTEIKNAGNIVVAEESGKPTRIVVLDGLRNAAELDPAGKLVRNVDLGLPTTPQEATVSYLRTTLDQDGKRYFVGSAPRAQQLHVFDSDLKKLLSFPEGAHDGISDVQAGDLNGDGRPEIVVGYFGVVGVQAVNLDGILQWKNRTLPEDVQHLALTKPNADKRRLVLCTTGNWQLAVLDEKGETVKQVPIGERAARLITRADVTDEGELCAIVKVSQQDDLAVGFSASGSEMWSYPLPPGMQPVATMTNEMVVGGKLLKDGTGLWVFAGADGSLHFVDHEGKPVDSFGWGSVIRGLAIGKLGDQPALLVSDENGVTALRLEK